MRRALARLLALVLTLTLTSLVALFALSRVADTPASEHVRLPLYFNPSPRNVHDLSRQAARAVTSDGPDRALAERKLVWLGGAALPHLLPLLETLPEVERDRLALALAPVARRMGVGSEAELTDPNSASAFWLRFWQDRAFDFRAPIVRRLVKRLAQKSSVVRREDLAHLDTYALPDLMAELGRVRSREDVERAARLTAALSHLLPGGRVVQPDSSLPEARGIVRAWQSTWTQRGADFLTLDGPQRLMALLGQTQLGHWLSGVLSALRNPNADVDANAVGLPFAGGAASLLRLLGAVALCLGVGAAWVRLEFGARGAVRPSLRLAAALTALPAPFLLAVIGAPSAAWARQLSCVVAAGLFCAGLVSRTALATRRSGRFATPGWRTAFGDVLSGLPAWFSWLLASVFCLELSLDLPGVAKLTLAALARGELGAGMTLALVGALLASGALTASRRALRSFELPDRSPALVLVEESRRLVVVGLVTALLLGLFGAGWSRGLPTAEPGWSDVAGGARTFLLYGGLSALVAAVLGLMFGALAASGPQLADSLLSTALSVLGSLPALFWVAAMVKSWGEGALCALGVGALRSLEVAWLLRRELARQAQLDVELRQRTLGRLPLRAYFLFRLRPALSPALAAVALTPAWALSIGVAGRLCGLPAAAGGVDWTRLLGGTPSAHWLPSLAASALLVLPCWVLLSALTQVPRRLGAFRSNPPPPDNAASSGG